MPRTPSPRVGSPLTLGLLARRYLGRHKRGGPRPHWVDDIVRPLAEALARQFPQRELELLGPSGLGAAVCVCLIRREAAQADRMRDRYCRSITLVPVDLARGAIGRRDYTRRVPGYAEGTLGALNGLQYAVDELPPETTPDDLVPLLGGHRWPDEDT